MRGCMPWKPLWQANIMQGSLARLDSFGCHAASFVGIPNEFVLQQACGRRTERPREPVRQSRKSVLWPVMEASPCVQLIVSLGDEPKTGLFFL